MNGAGNPSGGGGFPKPTSAGSGGTGTPVVKSSTTYHHTTVGTVTWVRPLATLSGDATAVFHTSTRTPMQGAVLTDAEKQLLAKEEQKKREQEAAKEEQKKREQEAAQKAKDGEYEKGGKKEKEKWTKPIIPAIPLAKYDDDPDADPDADPKKPDPKKPDPKKPDPKKPDPDDEPQDADKPIADPCNPVHDEWWCNNATVLDELLKGMSYDDSKNVYDYSGVSAFHDYVFRYQKLFEIQPSDEDTYDNYAVMPPWAKIDPEYNFHIKGYEEASENIPETLLPCLYAFASEAQKQILDSDETVWAKLITQGGAIQNIFTDLIVNKTQQKKVLAGPKVADVDSGEYFDKYIRAWTQNSCVSDWANGSDGKDLQNKYTNIVFSKTGMRMLEECKSKKNLFPMYVEINFQTETDTTMAQLLYDSGLCSELISWVVKFGKFDEDGMVQTEQEVSQHPSVAAGAVQSSLQNTLISSAQTFDIEHFFTDFIFDGLLNGNQAQIEIFTKLLLGGLVIMGADEEDDCMGSKANCDLLRRLTLIALYAKFADISQNGLRTLQEIFNGAYAPSETLFYQVSKYEYSGDDRKLLQNFYFANSNEIDTINFIDTQVKYNKAYEYDISAFQFVLGNDYHYLHPGDWLQTPKDPDAEPPCWQKANSAKYCVINKAGFKIFKVPLSTVSARIMDRPPVFPDVEIVPFRAVNDKLLFNMNSNVGLYRLAPIAIDDDDDSLLDEQRESQRSTDGLLEFKTDDRTTLFEVYRIENPPVSYRDFAGNKRKTVLTELKKDSGVFLPSAHFIDKVVPNKVYYYTIRTKDNHGNFSNPSPIYRVKLVDADGAVYPLIDIVELFPPGYGTRTNSKPMKRYVQIMPSLPQTLIDEATTFGNNPRQLSIVPDSGEIKSPVTLGKAPDKVWGQKYKIRFTSKKTGRKFDLHVDFNHQAKKGL
jgi:hypothetical protein